MDFSNDKNGFTSGLRYGAINLKSSIEDFLKEEYTDGLKNEFAVMDALINQIKKEQITGKKKYKTFALGIVDNVRSLGGYGLNGGGNGVDYYKVDAKDFIKGAETVDAEFDTTKLIGVFSITDELIMRGTGDGSIFDVLSDTLDRMNLGLKHTMQRYTYGSKNGRIGRITNVSAVPASGGSHGKTMAGKQSGDAELTNVFDIKMTNSLSILPGMEVSIPMGGARLAYVITTAGEATDTIKFKHNFEGTNSDEITLTLIAQANEDLKAGKPGIGTSIPTQVANIVKCLNTVQSDPATENKFKKIRDEWAIDAVGDSIYFYPKKFVQVDATAGAANSNKATVVITLDANDTIKSSGLAEASNDTEFLGHFKVFQKYRDAAGQEVLRIAALPGQSIPNGNTYTTFSTSNLLQGSFVFSRQIGNTVATEYTGLEDIVIDQSGSKLFGIDRSVYPSLKCLQHDMAGEVLTESALRDMSDYLELDSPEGNKINLVCSKHSIISCLEKQLYSLKEYSLDAGKTDFQLGRPTIRFDNFELRKDKYARDNNVYMIDTNNIGELIRKDFDWITSGREGILERLEGTEVYEAIMTKYADMFVDSFKAHASFINVSDTPANYYRTVGSYSLT